MAVQAATAYPPTPSAALAAAGGSVLRLSGPRGPWTYMISASALECRNGRILPSPAKAWHDTGFGGNVPGGQGSGMIAHLRVNSWVEVDRAREVVAFGVKRPDYLDRYDGVGPDGRHCVRFSDAWERPVVIGALVDWQRDLVGRDDWLESLIPLIAPGGLTETHVAIATTQLIRTCRRLLDRDDPRGKRLLGVSVAHLPESAVPEDLRAAWEAQEEVRLAKRTPAEVRRDDQRSGRAQAAAAEASALEAARAEAQSARDMIAQLQAELEAATAPAAKKPTKI